MERRKLDYLIVGQGLAGSWLGHELIRRERKVLILNHETENTSTLKAAGIYNPITGRNMVKTWLADQLFSQLEEKYASLEKKLGVNFLHPIPIYRPFISIEEKNDWDGKITDTSFAPYVDTLETKSLYSSINDELGGIVLKKTGYVNLPEFTASFRNYLVEQGSYQSAVFDYDQLELEDECIRYKEFEASMVIFCEGANLSNPFWGDLPFRNVRGELFDINSPIKTKHIINRGIFIIPKDGYFTVGSTYDHKILSFEPQEKGINDLKGRLEKLLNSPYDILRKKAGVRPATYDRKPFIGLHRKFKRVGIFNGFGTKGVSLTPYFASHFADFLVNQTKIDKEVNVERVY